MKALRSSLNQPFSRIYSNHSGGIKWYILPPLVLVVCVLQAVFVVTFLQNQKQRITEAGNITTEEIQQLFSEEIQHNSEKMAAILDFLVRDPQLFQAFVKQDRKTLRQQSEPIFEQLRSQYQISHWYFHLPNRVNFLRVHGPVYGDRIERTTIKQAEQTGAPSFGLEQGLTGNPVLRMVYPWRQQSPPGSNSLQSNAAAPLAGYMELGIEFEDIADEVKELSDIDIILLVDKSMLDRQLWEQRNRKLARQSQWDDFSDFVVLDSTMDHLPLPLETLLHRASHDFETVLKLPDQKRILQVSALPLMGNTEQALGQILILNDITPIIQTADRALWLTSSVSLTINVGVLLFFYILLHRLEKTLAERSAKLIETREGLKQSNQALEASLHQLKQAQGQLVQHEKMSALGRLVAGIAHEINNPIGFIYGNLVYVKNYTCSLLEFASQCREANLQTAPELQKTLDEIDLDFLIEDLPKTVQSMQHGADRIREIVVSLRNFSRLDEAELKSVDIHQGIDSTLMLLQHHFKSAAGSSIIQVIKEYGELPQVSCYAGQLNQVCMNILTNAIDAFSSVDGLRCCRLRSPIITIRTECIGSDYVKITIADNGPGIPTDVQPHIFDPFFTTKPIGQGSGMGLAISHQIIAENHRGQLNYISTPGQGTEFIIQIPIHLQQQHVRQQHVQSAADLDTHPENSIERDLTLA